MTVNIQRRGFMFVLSSPSGAGKTTLSRLLLERDQNLTMSVSMTTRPKRPNEVEGKDYYFVSKEQFRRAIENNELMEHATVFENLYGTPQKKVLEQLDKGTDVLFDIDWQGTHQLEARCPDDIVSVFILPPSMKALEERLRHRAQDSDAIVKQRMEKAGHEISHWYSYNYVLVNDDVDACLERIHAILIAERHRRARQHGLNVFIRDLLK